MNVRYILVAFAIVFIAAALVRLQRDGGRVAPASKTWFLAGAIFTLVSIWLWLQ